jgi:hypothetical protein
MGTLMVAPPLPPDEPKAPDDPDVVDPEPDPGRPGPSPSPDPIRWPSPGSPDNPVPDDSLRDGGAWRSSSAMGALPAEFTSRVGLRPAFVLLVAFRKW